MLQKRKELASPRSAHLSPGPDPAAGGLQLAQVSTARTELRQPHQLSSAEPVLHGDAGQPEMPRGEVLE